MSNLLWYLYYLTAYMFMDGFLIFDCMDVHGKYTESSSISFVCQYVVVLLKELYSIIIYCYRKVWALLTAI
jgi:hypothetical protein